MIARAHGKVMLKRRMSRVRGILPPLLGVLLFAVAVEILRRELHAYQWSEVTRELATIPAWRVAVALLLTAASYLALTGYDALAIAFVGAKLPYPGIALASFVSYALSHNLGAAFLSGGAVRYRLYSAWGLAAIDVAKVVAFNTAAFWLGALTVLGAALLAGPVILPDAPMALSAISTHMAGCAAVAGVAAYLVLCAFRVVPIRWRQHALRLPSVRLAAGQIAVGALDWLLATLAFFVLLPSGAASFRAVAAAFVLAQVAGILSTVPAGLGVFETGIVMLLGRTLTAPALLASLVAYRLVYYVLPLIVAVLLLAGYEIAQRRAYTMRVGRALGRWTRPLVPHAFAAATFLGGVILLLSGATPAADGRLDSLRDVVPLPVLEISHFTGSVVGLGLLLLARGLQRRLDGAYLLSIALLFTGIAASLIKGLDYEEAIYLAVILAALVPCRREFYRKAALLDEPLSPAWAFSILLVAIGVTWVLLVVYQHVEYSNDLWWRFEFEGDAPRSLRASVGAALLLGIYGAHRLLRNAQPHPVAPSAEELERAAAIVAASPSVDAHLALLGDKRFLFSPNGRAFIMYGVARRAWVAMGDPVGPPEEARELAWRFRELSDRQGGLTVFYEVGTANLPVYLDLGLSLLKLGEEARVPLQSFSLEGHARKGLRTAHRQAEREGCRIEIVMPQDVAAIMPDLRAISNAWLAEKHTREKGFSLGFFSPAYLERCPVAVVRHENRMVAFANLWCGAGHEELSVDLMRQLPDGASRLMDYLFVELMLWGRREGYGWFNFGVAPLAGLEDRALAPLWHRIGALLFRHGRHFYNFAGLREYKDKFDPVWTPRYLAYPGALVLPDVLMRVAALVSGGVGGVFRK